MIPSPLVPRAAATLILARDSADGIEVFLMQRTHQASFLAGAYVFPGGAVDAADSDDAVSAFRTEVADGATRPGLMEGDGLVFRVAAIRECFEESGLLLANDKHGMRIELSDAPAVERFALLRSRLADGEITLSEICRDCNLRLAADDLAYFSRWVTPLFAPRRFDTRFFVTVGNLAQTPSHDDRETIAHAWLRPADALVRHREGTLSLAFATVRTLEALTLFDDTAALMTHARALSAIDALLPWPAMASDGRRMLVAGDAAYAEVKKLDPAGQGTASCEILPGIVTQLSPRVRRIAAPNPSFMTGPGTNTYLIGTGDDLAVIDPGPALEDHVQSILAHADGRIRSIFVTHTHGDHSPAALRLKQLTGAVLLGMPPPDHDNQDRTFRPDRVPMHGERITAGGCTLRVIHTPGHASNHLCYLLEEEQLLFTGDHVMQGSTVVINPPDGDMSAYLASLRSLDSEDIAFFAPGHGFLMDRPRERIARILAHRLAREDKVIAALARLGSATEAQLLEQVYGDVPSSRWRMAGRSLLAHLLKLRGDGLAVQHDGQWATVAPD